MLRSGSTGSVIIPVNSENVAVIPQKATFEIQDKKFVYVVNKDPESGNYVISNRGIEVLPQSDGQHYVVLSGLQPGDQIVVEGVGTGALREGSQIKPVDAAEMAARQAQQPQQPRQGK